MYVILYLGAIVAANLIIGEYGPAMVMPVAFFLIGLDLTARDALHDAWRSEGLKWKMAGLILVGSALTVILNADALRIAVASTAAFALAAVSDTLIYAVLGERARLVRMNGSNVVSAAVDSLAFPTLAFGAVMPVVIVGQFAAKVAGGAVWSLVIHAATRERRVVLN